LTSDAEYKSNKARSLIVGGSSATVSTESKGGRLISRMNEDALTVINSTGRDLTPVMRQISDGFFKFEFHEEDYNQLSIWSSYFTKYDNSTSFHENDNAELAIDIASRQSLINPRWLTQGRIRQINFEANFMKWLDLSSVPSLSHLECRNNELTEIDLSKVPNLTELWCHNNKLSKIDLSKLKFLKKLGCRYNQLTQIDLSEVPELAQVWCSDNLLTELDISSLQSMSLLSCSGNNLTELDIRNCHSLTTLYCDPGVTITKNPDQNVKVERV